MKSTSRIFYGLAVFMLIMTVVYSVGTVKVNDDANLQGAEWAGIVGLALSTLLLVMLAVYLDFTERHVDLLPEDWEEAEVEDKAGVMGFFSASSIWPFVMAAAVAVLAIAIAFWHLWMIALGAILLIFASTKLNLQYGVPREKH